VPRLRKLNEGFRTPGLIVPILGVLVGLIMIVALVENPNRLIAAALAVLSGVVVYLLTKPSSS